MPFSRPGGSSPPRTFCFCFHGLHASILSYRDRPHLRNGSDVPQMLVTPRSSRLAVLFGGEPPCPPQPPCPGTTLRDAPLWHVCHLPPGPTHPTRYARHSMYLFTWPPVSGAIDGVIGHVQLCALWVCDCVYFSLAP